jgi:hypothetical protein
LGSPDIGDEREKENPVDGDEFTDLGTSNGRSRQRSPNYPIIGLEEAVRRVRRLYQAEGQTDVPREAALKHLGYDADSGTARAMLSALRKFGLLDYRDGKIVVSSRAVDILEFGQEHSRHLQALKAAALAPDVYSQLVAKYRRGGRLPSDVSLRPVLIADLGFNPKVADSFLKDFRGSLEYAGVLDGNQLRLPEQSGQDQPDESPSTDDAMFPPDPREKDRGYRHAPTDGQPILSLLIGFVDEQPTYAQVSFSRPVRKGFLRRLARQLEALEAGADPEVGHPPRPTAQRSLELE